MKAGAFVLVVSNKHDAHVPLVVPHLEALGARYFVLNTEDFGTVHRAEFSLDQHGPSWALQSAPAAVPVDEITAVWYRRPEKPELGRFLDAEARRFAEAELSSFIDSFLVGLECFWLSDPAAIRRAGHKLDQLSLARKLGFEIPPTLVSQDPESIREFARNVGRPIVAKLISKGPPRTQRLEDQYVVFTEVIDAQRLGDDATLSSCPAIYQAYVDKAYELRVTVVGKAVFACRIDSQATESTRIDWRNYDLENTPHSAVELDQELRAKCIALVRSYGLQFGAIDLIVSPEGRAIFLEINPNGQWGWIEELSGLPIARAHADLLCGAQ